ncbi:U1 small nuclear ribonucleoprotein A [Hyaloraphidium curvatum]|nr:U1 small nuclear ribonucleoprotein A [Hyaloraphidium curvatum]
MQQPPIPMPGGFPALPFPFPSMPVAVNPKAARYPKPPKRPPPTESNRTLYVHNLHDKKSKSLLTKELMSIFGQYGDILEISVKKRLKMRGQAFVVFKELESAETALKELQGFPLFNKPMDIQYAREKSDTVAKLDGTLEENKRLRAERKANAKDSDEEEEDEDIKEESEEEGEEGEGEEERPAKKAKKENRKDAQPAAPAAAPFAFPNAFGFAPDGPPNSILFVQNVPAEVTEEALSALFQQYQGFKEVRLVRRNNVAFVEYESEGQAIVAKMALHGYKVTDEALLYVTYAKK